MIFSPILQKTKTKTTKNPPPKRRMGILAFFVFLNASLVGYPMLSQARIFDPNNIITDQELLNKNSLSKAAIQEFLKREDGVLSRYSQIINGKTMSSAEMIWEVSQKHDINPKFILTNLEKEQGLIHSNQATEKALDWATGYGCYGGGCKEKYRGFYNQIEATAETQQIYWDKAGQWAFKVGQTTNSYDDYPVKPANQATANLYVYTPYVGYSPEIGVTAPYGGNRLFWRIWQRYFTNQKFLDGQVITNNNNFWLIQDNQKRKFASKDLFLADYELSDAITVSSEDLVAYPDGSSIDFAENTLVRSTGSNQIYLLADNQKRKVTDDSALALLSDFSIAINTGDIPTVLDSQLTNYEAGVPISGSSVYPQGKLFKDPTGKIWQIKNGIKYEVDNLVWQNRFNSEATTNITTNELEKYLGGNPIKLKDGTFVTNNNKYYLIANGERMKIEDLSIFNRVFGSSKKTNALKITTALLEVHDAGDTIDYIDDTITDPVVNAPTTSLVGNYQAIFHSMTPDSLTMMTGQTQSVTITFKNTGTTKWNQGDVWLKITDKGADASSFTSIGQINFNEAGVSSSQLANFTFDLTAPTDQGGILTQEFSLYYTKNNVPTKIISLGKFIIVKPGTSAQILEHNIPVAVRNNWQPINITIKIKNTSADTTWLSRRTALEIYNDDGSTSYFYDPNDWVRETVAAVPINDTYIEPGEVGEFKFTLDPRNIKPNSYILNFQLKLLDQDGKQIFLDGQERWRREIRVD